VRPAVHVALLVLVVLLVPVSIGFVVWTGSETCGDVGAQPSFQCSELAETLGLVLVYGLPLVGAALLIYGVFRLIRRMAQLPRKTPDSS
jgi:hypothetical protein